MKKNNFLLTFVAFGALVFATLLGVWVLPHAVNPVIAQEAEQENQEQPAQEPALPNINESAAEAKKKYLLLLTDYRDKEQKFSVLRAQYAQLQTLGALEDAVIALKEVLIARDNALYGYFVTLRQTVQEAKGIELERKESAIAELDRAMSSALGHGGSVQSADDWVALDSESETLAGSEESFITASYRANSLLRIGYMQAAIDQIVVASQKVREYLGGLSLSATETAEKDRGFAEFDRTVAETKTAIQLAYEELDKRDDVRSTDYARITSILNNTYPKLRQAESFIRELADR